MIFSMHSIFVRTHWKILLAFFIIYIFIFLEFDCKYGELKIRNNHRWTGELCGGVLACKNGIIHLEKCPGIPPKPKDCANPKLYVKQRPGRCCIKKWLCKGKDNWDLIGNTNAVIKIVTELMPGIWTTIFDLVKLSLSSVYYSRHW